MTAAEVLLSEYSSIKDEQKNRIGFRDNLIYATLASIALVVTAAVQVDDGAQLLTLLPPAVLLLGWTYLINDEKISAIGRYVRLDLGPRVAALVPGVPEPFGWETAHRSDHRRIARKYLQLSADLVLFCGVPLAALVVCWSTASLPWPVLAVSLAETAATLVLAVQIIQYADLRRGR